jgi:hypothetical protein
MDMAMYQLAPMGHNSPPSPIDDALAPFGDTITEAENWLDGARVENEAQMKAVDALIKDMKAARKAVDDARDLATKPLNEAWKAEIARWKPTQDDLDLQVKGLVALVDGFKRQLAAEKEAARKAAWEAAEAARREAEAKMAAADEANIEAQREARAAMEAADYARAQAAVAQKDTVKGMRTVTKYEITDHRALLNFIAKNARDDVTAFIEEWARKNHKQFTNADGLKVWTEKEAF